jgi:hypothetical protein
MLSPVKSIDSESNYELGSISSKSSSPRETTFTGSLPKAVEEYQRRDQLEILCGLSAESSQLLVYIVQYQTKWCYIIELLEKAQNALKNLQNCLQKCFHEQLEAEKHWLGVWRLHEGISNNTDYYSPTGWI